LGQLGWGGQVVASWRIWRVLWLWIKETCSIIELVAEKHCCLVGAGVKRTIFSLTKEEEKHLAR